MKNKAPLALMEQLVMLLVFALAAALCLQIYALSGKVSRRGEAQGPDPICGVKYPFFHIHHPFMPEYVPGEAVVLDFLGKLLYNIVKR